MGVEASGWPLIDAARVDEKASRLMDEESARTERAQRSPLISALLASLVALPATAIVLARPESPAVGELTPGTFALIALATWTFFELASTTYRLLGGAHPISRFAATLDQLSRSAGLMMAMVLSGPATGIFLLVSLLRGFVRRAQSAAQRRRTVATQAIAHLSVGGAALLLGRPTGAMLVLLAFLAFLIAFTMTARSHETAVRARVERDLLEHILHGVELGSVRSRMAREIHDGVGADLMALVLQLRRLGKDDPAGSELSREAQHILEDLRSVVWSLRGEEGTLGELGKLLEAKCARLCAGVSFERVPIGEGAQRALRSETALALLRVAPAMVEVALHRGSVKHVRLSLTAGEVLELRVEAEGGSAPGAEAERLLGARSLVEAEGGSLSAASAPDGRLTGLCATLPL